MTILNLRSGLVAISIVFFVLSILAIYNIVQVGSLRLPVSSASVAFSLLVPIAEFFGSIWLIFSTKYRTSIVINLSWVLSMLDGAIITLAASDMSGQALDCSLESLWRQWFQSKDSRAIRSIQNAFECCGLRSSVDKAWPFPDATHGADACRIAYNRSNSCYTDWSHATRRGFSMMLAIGAVSLGVKLLICIAIQIRLSFTERPLPRWQASVQSRQAILHNYEGEGESQQPRYTDEVPSASNSEQNT